MPSSHGFRRLLSHLPSTLALALAAPGAAAVPQNWGVQFGSDKSDGLRDVVPDGQGGTLAAGQTNGPIGTQSGGNDVFVVRTAAGGTQQWVQQVGTTSLDEPAGIAADGTGGVFVAGSTLGSFTPSYGDTDGFLMRFDGAGNLLWARNVGTDEPDLLAAVVPDGAGGGIAVGRTPPGPPGSVMQLWFVRFDGSGAILWSKTHLLPGSADPRCAIADGQGGLFVAGMKLNGSGQFAEGDAFLSRVSAAGDVVWTQYLATNQHERIEGVAPDGSGGVYVAGHTEGALAQAQGARDAFVARFDGSGAVQWVRQIGTSSVDDAWSATGDGLGGVMVCGNTEGSLAGPFGGVVDAWLMRLDGAGNPIWSQQLGGAGADRVLSVCSFEPQQFVAVGSTSASLFGPSQGGSDAWIANFDFCSSPPPTNYCTASPNSTGQGAAISQQGSTQVALNDFGLTVSGCLASQIGLFLLAQGQASIPFGDGVLCLGGAVSRILPALSTGGAGSAALTLDLTDPSSSASQVDAGETWNFQFWYRDTASLGVGFNLSNGLSATFCP